MPARIPKAYRKALAEFAGLSDAKFSALVKALGGDGREGVKAIAERVAKYAKLDVTSASEVLGFLASLYPAAGWSGDTLADFADEVAEAARASAAEPPPFKPFSGDWGKLRKRLRQILTTDNALGTAAKAADVATEYPHLFQLCRILTDIRPVFGATSPLSLKGGVISHCLRIVYFDSESSLAKFFVALDKKDLERLKTQVERALQKDEQLRRELSGKLKILEVSDQ